MLFRNIIEHSFPYTLKYSKHPHLDGFFDTEVDRTGNPNTNIWNIPQFSSIYTCDFTTHISSK